MNKLLRVNYSLYIGVFLVSVLLFFAVFGPYLAPHQLSEALETQYRDGKVLAPPIQPFESGEYPLGTDRWGYDIASMILNGLKYTVFIAIAVTFIKMVLGTIIGLYVGTWKRTPGWLLAFENAWSFVPLFLIVYFFFRGINTLSFIPTWKLIMLFILITSLVSIPSIVSSVRQKTAELNKSVYIEAARALGAGRHRLIWKHIFPQLKETFLVMFILEIVYVITIMGQLGLLEIFVGGTRVTYDPLLFHSITKELAGLVGQARGNIYGNLHILMVPLAVLLITTISFSLLANGMKNRFQSNYQRTPWIKTGQEPKLKPVRKNYIAQKGRKLLSPEPMALIILLILFISAGTYVYATKDQDIGVKNFSQAEYDLRLKMNKQGEFSSTANIEVKNKSEDEWDKLVFYFIPNVFKEGHSFQSVEGYASVTLNHIKVDGKEADYELKDDTLSVFLSEKMDKGDKGKVEINYEFTLPEKGNRFSKVDKNYYLAQWYPMLATFREHKWNKEKYSEGLETYHTDFSDYKVSYDIPKGYTIASTADEDPPASETRGTLKAEKVRDFFISILKDTKVYEAEAKEGVKVRLFTEDDHNKDPEQSLDLAKKALSFYQDKIGEYPHETLDVVLDEGQFMEYPGIVTINPYIEDSYFYQVSIVHEIAHQYFYGTVSNDPYYEAWVDEGITEFATSMYFYAGKGEGEIKAFSLPLNRMKSIEEESVKRQHSNVPLDEVSHNGYVYGQPAVKLLELVNNRFMVKGNDPRIVGMEFLSAYYEKFKFKEVDSKMFADFAADYFLVPKGYFTDWLTLE